MSFLNGFEKIVRECEPLAMHTWFQLGGPAEFFAEPETPEQLSALLKRCAENQKPVRLLGRGSNLLVRDEGVKGVVVHLSAPAFHEIRVDDQRVIAGGGASLGRVVTTAVRHGLAGLESLIAIPGTIGGALHGNAGAQGSDIGQWTRSVTVLSADGQPDQRERDELQFSYRQSNLDDLAIVEADFELEQDDPRELVRRMQKNWIVKKAAQPLAHQCAGCVFKNPPGGAAAELIEAAGLKGTRIGGAMVSERHAGFIVADSDCSASDVLRLIHFVRDQVRERMGVELQLEIEIW